MLPPFDPPRLQRLRDHLKRDDPKQTPPSSLRSLLEWVREHLKLLCCKETLGKALHHIGFSYKKARKLLQKANANERKSYMERLQTLLDEARRGRRYLVFLDEAHVHQGLDPGYGWGVRGEPLLVASPSLSRRKRVSFYGLYLYNDGVVRIWGHREADGVRTCDVLRRLRRELPAGVPVTLIWDNAGYHLTPEVQAVAKSLEFALEPLPRYSPDLMPVEELWSWFRSEVTRNRVFLQRKDLTRAAAEFERKINAMPYAVADRLVVLETLDEAREKLLAS